jgi:hypothetical protein
VLFVEKRENLRSPIHAILCEVDLASRRPGVTPSVARVVKVQGLVSDLKFQIHSQNPSVVTLVQDGEDLLRRMAQRLDWLWRLKSESPAYRDHELQTNPEFIDMCCKVLSLVSRSCA